MNATITLVRVQTQILAGPLAALAAGLILLLVPTESRNDILSAVVGTLTILAVALSGPMLFGVECQEGALGFLATRPASPRLSFLLKVGFLSVISVPGAIIIHSLINVPHLHLMALGFRAPFERLIPLVWAFLFNFTLVCAAVTLFFRDTVRGLLFGEALFVCAGVVFHFALWNWLNHERHPFGNLFFDETRLSPPMGKVILYCGALCLSPCLSMAFLSLAHRWERLGGQWSVPSSTYVLLSVFVSYLMLAGVVSSYEGRSKWEWIESKAIGTRMVNQDTFLLVLLNTLRPQLKWINMSRAEEYDRETRTVDFDGDFKGRVGIDAIYLKEDRLLLEGSLGRTDQEEASAFIGAHIIGEGTRTTRIAHERASLRPREIIELRDQRVGITFTETQEQPQPPQAIVDFKTGVLRVVDTAEEKKEIETERHLWRTGNRVYSWPRWSDGVEVAEGASLGASMSAAAIPPLDRMTVEGSLLAGIGMSLGLRFSSDYPGWWEATNGEKIILFDSTDLASPEFRHIDLPLRSYGVVRSLDRLLQRLGLIPSRDVWNCGGNLILLGDGVLVLAMGDFGCAFAWDLSDPGEALYLGSAPIPSMNQVLFVYDRFQDRRGFHAVMTGPCTPIRRHDGALGYLTDYAILWLEFPALMKTHAPTTQPSRDHQAAGEKPS